MCTNPVLWGCIEACPSYMQPNHKQCTQVPYTVEVKRGAPWFRAESHAMGSDFACSIKWKSHIFPL